MNHLFAPGESTSVDLTGQPSNVDSLIEQSRKRIQDISELMKPTEGTKKEETMRSSQGELIMKN